MKEKDKNMGIEDALRNAREKLKKITNPEERNPQNIAQRSQDTSSVLSDIDKIINDTNALIHNEITRQQNRPSSVNVDPDDVVPPFIRNYQEAQKSGQVNPSETDRKNLDDLSKVIGSNNHSNEDDDKEKVTKTAPKKGKFEEQAEPTRKLLERKYIRGLGKEIKKNVFGQDKTIDSLEAISRVSALNLESHPTKPVGSFLFVGPSGVGKTEVAKQLARILEVPFFKLDMGEYGEKQSVSRLLGAAPGLVGYDQGGQLTGPVIKEPVCVLCLDEIEKANRDIDNILLALLDEGVATDSRGIKVKYKEVIIIVTTNLGAKVEYIDDMSFEQVKMMIFEQGWGKDPEFADEVSEDEQRQTFKNKFYMKSVRDTIKPEIVNRFDRVISFNSLELDVYKKVTEKFTNELVGALQKEHQKESEFTPKALDFIVENSYDRARGGRPAKKFIKEVIVGHGLANYMLSEEYEAVEDKITKFIVDINDKNQVVFKDQEQKVLYTIENTQELLESLEGEKVTRKKPKEEKKDQAVISEPIETPIIDVVSEKVEKKTRKPKAKLPEVSQLLVENNPQPARKRKP